MITLARWVLMILYRRFRWVALGAALRTLTRRSRAKSVDDATDELADRLPDSVVRAIDAARVISSGWAAAPSPPVGPPVP